METDYRCPFCGGETDKQAGGYDGLIHQIDCPVVASMLREHYAGAKAEERR